jgi:hypothetical protein
MPEFTLPTTQEEFEKAGSKFITFSPDDEVGKLYYKDIEMDMPDWDTPGQSIKFPVRITEEGPDFGKEDKISAGVSQAGIWKLKDLLKALDVAVEMRKGADKKVHPVFASEAVAGKPAVGVWQVQIGAKGGDASKGTIKYPKLVNIMPAGSKPAVEELV